MSKKRKKDQPCRVRNLTFSYFSPPLLFDLFLEVPLELLRGLPPRCRDRVEGVKRGLLWRRRRSRNGAGRRRRAELLLLLCRRRHRRRRRLLWSAAAAAPSHRPCRDLRVRRRSSSSTRRRKRIPFSFVAPGRPSRSGSARRPRCSSFLLRLGLLASGLPRSDLRPQLRAVRLRGEPLPQPLPRGLGFFVYFFVVVVEEGGEGPSRREEAAAAAAASGDAGGGRASSSSSPPSSCPGSSDPASSSFPPQGPGHFGGGLGCDKPGSRGPPRSGHFFRREGGKSAAGVSFFFSRLRNTRESETKGLAIFFKTRLSVAVAAAVVVHFVYRSN